MESSNSYLSYNNNNTRNTNYAEEEEEEEEKRSSSSNKTFYSSLHAVRKPLILKKPIAPLPPTKPRVYKVHPTKFKEVVQRLTAASPDQFHSRPRRLDDIAPPPLDLNLMISPITTTTTTARSATNCVPLQNSSDQSSLDWSTDLIKNNNNIVMMGSNDNSSKKAVAAVIPVEMNKLHNKYLESCGALSPLEFNFSPSGMTWPFSPLLSPGTLSSLDHTTVL